MTISVVQANNGTGALAGNSLSFASNVTIGNSIAVWIGDYNVSGAVISSSAPTYNGSPVTGATKLVEVQNTASGTSNIMYFAVWLLPNVQSAGKPVGISPSTNAQNDTNSHYYIAEIAGLGASPAADPASPNPATAFSSAGGVVSSGATGNAAGSSGIVLGGMMQDGENAGWTGPGGWTTIAGTPDSYAGASYQIFTSPGSAYTWTPSDPAAGQWAAGAVILDATPPAQAAPLTPGPARARTRNLPRRGKAAGAKATAPPGTYRLFPSTSGPSSPVSYSGNFLAGVLFKVTQGGMWFNGYYKWVAPGGDTVARKFALWTIKTAGAGATLIPAATVTSGTLTAGQWNFIPLPTPVPLAIGTAYNACTGWSAVNGFEDSDTSGAGTGAADSFGAGGHTTGITQGPLFAYSDGGGSPGTAPPPYGMPQGAFSVAGTDPTVNMPATGSNSGNFWMDVQVSDTGPPGYSGSYRLYPNKSDANPFTSNDSSVNYVIATEFRLSRPCTLNKIWYYSPSGTAQLATSCRIWSIQGADAGTSIVTNTSPSWSGAAASGWVSCSFSGVTLPAGAYKVSIYNNAGSPDGWGAKDASTNYWATGDGANGITWGPLTAPGLPAASQAYIYNGSAPGSTPPYTTGSTEPGQSTFVNGTGDTYPYLYVDGLAQNYWLDVEVTPFTFYGQSKAAATARPMQKLPRGRGTGTKTSAPLAVSTSVSGVTGTITVAAPAGTVTAVTGSPGRTLRRPLPIPRRGHGGGTKKASPTNNPVVATTSLADIAQNVQVRRWLTATGGTPAYTWAVTAGSLPAGLSLASDGTLSGTPTGTGTSSFTVQVTDAASGTGTASLSLTSVSAPFSPTSPTTDGNGVITWSVTSVLNQNDAESVRVLNPVAPNVNYPHGFLVTLPVAAGTDDTTFGNGLDTVRTLGLHNAYNLTVIEPSTDAGWLADNPDNSSDIQETYLLQVAAWAQATYATTGTEKIYLIGFSRSGIAAQGLFFHRPDLYYAAASWDFPAMMTGYDGTDPNLTVGGSPDSSYGTQDNFAANYELSPANLAKWAAGQDFGTVTRIWIGGYFTFQADVSQYDPVLTTAGILHYYSSVSQSEHNWSPSPGWVATAIAALVTPNTASTGNPARARNSPPFRRSGTGRGTFAVTSQPGNITGTPGQISVTAPAGQIQAYTGITGRIIRPRQLVPRTGTGRGTTSAVQVPGIVAGTAGQVTVSGQDGAIAVTVNGTTGQVTLAAPAGTIQAFTGTPGRAVRRRPPPPRRGTGTGIFLVAPVPGVVAGTPGLIGVTAPAGTITTTSTGGANVAGPAGVLTLTAVIGTVTAVTGTPGRQARSRTPMPPPARRGHGGHGTTGTAVHGPAGIIFLRGPAGTVQAFTGTPGKTTRLRTAMPPRRGTGRGIPSGVAAVIAGVPGTITVTSPAGGISTAIPGTFGAIAVTGPAGFVVLTPYRYTRWNIKPGFTPSGPRSHLVHGSPGRITLTAPAGTVAAH